MYENKKNSNKMIALVLVLALLIGCTIGGTLAWLATQTDPVTNTFTIGKIELELKETYNAKSDEEKQANDIWVGKVVPGMTLDKDPKVIVKAGSEACWLFVKIEETEAEGKTKQIVNLATETADETTFITYQVDVDSGWNVLDGVPGVYYRQINKATALAGNESDGYAVLKDNQVSVPNTVTEAMLKSGEVADLKLTFTAYAIQSEHLTKKVDATDVAVTQAADAWALLEAQIAADNAALTP